MKRSLLFIPVTLVALILLTSFFVLKGNDAEKATAENAQSLSRVLLSDNGITNPFTKAPAIRANKSRSGLANIVLKSADGGQTWQDISEGLPEQLQKEGVQPGAFFANNNGLYIRAQNGIYHSKPYSETSFWTKEFFPGKQRSITPGQNGIFAYNFRGQFLQKINGKSGWLSMYTNFQEQAIRLNKMIDWMYTNYHEKQVCSVFETTGGTVFIGSNSCFFKSTNNGKTWKHVYIKGWVMKMVESNGVLLTATTQGIFRSTDDGENWERVISEGGVGVSVEPVKGGFAAIAHNPINQTNSIHISLDSGKTWNAVGTGFQPSWDSSIKQMRGLSPSLQISSIQQVGEYLIGSRPDGIFRSSDMGKTWKLLLPSMENRGFKLSVSGNVIYAIPNKGC